MAPGKESGDQPRVKAQQPKLPIGEHQAQQPKVQIGEHQAQQPKVLIGAGRSGTINNGVAQIASIRLAMKTMADAARTMMTAARNIVAMVARVAAAISRTQIIITVLDIQA